jgi:hypothetical protein
MAVAAQPGASSGGWQTGMGETMQAHITNGDQAAGLLRQIVGTAPLIAWRDLLHEGPVPAGLPVDALAAVRACFIAGCGWGGFADVLGQFTARDKALAELDGRTGITLWFEHDLYDQLQLLQVLDRLAELPDAGSRVALVQAQAYLGALSTVELADLGTAARPVRGAQFALAQEAWGAFTAATPERLAELAGRELDELPFLRQALLRLLDELPSPRSGLGRTERVILRQLAAEPLPARRLYARVQEEEAAIFMGDSCLFRLIEGMIWARTPLIEPLEAGEGLRPGFAGPNLDVALRPTREGEAALAGQLDRLSSGPIDRWLGGTHLMPGSIWRWDRRERRLSRDQGVR